MCLSGTIDSKIFSMLVLDCRSYAAGISYLSHQIIYNFKCTKTLKLNQVALAVFTQFKYKINICSPLIFLFHVNCHMKFYGVYSRAASSFFFSSQRSRSLLTVGAQQHLRSNCHLLYSVCSCFIVADKK